MSESVAPLPSSGARVSPAAAFPPVKRSEIFGWCCFDFANSAFTTIIITVIYAQYFMGVVAQGHASGPAWWGRALAASQVVVILLSPLIGAVADAKAAKKRFLMTTALVCSIATMALYWVGQGEIWFALGLVAVANIAFSLSENLCAAFLPEISTPENAGRISGFGWSFGYFGGLLSLVLALVVIKSGEGRVPWTFVMTGAFFLLASLPTLLLLRERAVARPLKAGENYLKAGWRANLALLKELPQHRTLFVFFIAMVFFIAGLMAVISFSSIFADQVLKMTMGETVTLFMVLQIAGVVGAVVFGLVQDRVGSKAALIASLILWVIVSVSVAWCQTKGQFMAIGVVAGLALGSLQSAGRAVVSMLTPPGRSGEFFGCWGFFGKLAALIGPLVFGELAAAFGYRAAILTNGGFFLVGLLIVATLDLRKRALVAEAVGAPELKKSSE
jgi:UMF1 family MFS transporter